MKLTKFWIILDQYDNAYTDGGDWSHNTKHAKRYMTYELAYNDARELRKHFGQCYVYMHSASV